MAKSKILVMDDEELVRDTAKEMLECTGFDVDVATHGAEAIVKYKNAIDQGDPFNAIIRDLSVRGGLGGKETLGELLKSDSGVRAIVSTGNMDDDIVNNYKSYGFRAAIGKPYNLAELHQTLNITINTGKAIF